ncbi:MAG: ribosome small subunit-dependent GTPase A [Actinobacteria bacterium]|nr:ribosome small subunit-dependent GTPase A [Actinomycetota bacterium]
MRLANIGLTQALKSRFQSPQFASFIAGRVVAEHRERYDVITSEDDYDCEVVGRLRFNAEGRDDFPAVGDWVAVSPHGSGKGIIHHVLERHSTLERQAVGKYAEKQIIASNVDVALIVVALDRDFVVNRIDRYLTICRGANIEPVVVLSKTDLVSHISVAAAKQEIENRHEGVSVLAISSHSRDGYNELRGLLTAGKTYCLLGSSGVGKSTLVNTLVGSTVLDTGEIGTTTNKGRHVTTHRELVVLPDGGCLIDNPGMREVGTADAAEGLADTFVDIAQLTHECRFRDCQHLTETGCAVKAALAEGTIDEASLESFQKLEREQAHYQASDAQKRSKAKQLTKRIKSAKSSKGSGR